VARGGGDHHDRIARRKPTVAVQDHRPRQGKPLHRLVADGRQRLFGHARVVLDLHGIERPTATSRVMPEKLTTAPAPATVAVKAFSSCPGSKAAS
jgi:hypothetical protein